MLTAYRRHSADCPGAARGMAYTLCNCPIWIYGTLPTGEPIRRSLGTRDWPRALRRIGILEHGGELLPESDGRPLAVAIAAFLADARTRGLAESTVHSYQVTLDYLAAHLGKGGRLPHLDLDRLTGYRASRQLAPATHARETRILRLFCAWCVQRGWLGDNPAQRLSMPATGELVTQPFTAGEVSRLIAACDKIASGNPADTPWIRRQARALVLTLLYSGLRISDVAKLERAALEPSGHLVLRRVQKTGVPIKVLLHPDCVAALRALPASNPTYFFWSGRGVSATTKLRKTIYRLGKIAEVHATPHRFRDTFAVELLSEGADIRTVQKLLGHRSVRTTERHYAHFVAEHQRLLDDAAAKLDFSPKAARPVLVRKRR